MANQPRVIKAGQVAGLKPIEFNAADTLAETQRRIDDARKEIEALQAKAKAEAARLLEKAHQEGFRAGYEEGLAKGQAEAHQAHRNVVAEEVGQRLATLMPALEQVVQQLVKAKDEWIAEWEVLGIRLACATARKILRHELQQSPDAVQRVLQEVLTLVGRCPEVTIVLHPRDAESMTFDKDRLATLSRALGKVTIKADDTITPGGCRVISEFGTIDATLETQLARIEAELLGTEDANLGTT